jgi:hypothetical protein
MTKKQISLSLRVNSLINHKGVVSMIKVVSNIHLPFLRLLISNLSLLKINIMDKYILARKANNTNNTAPFIVSPHL